jgi:hypothetical protein
MPAFVRFRHILKDEKPADGGPKIDHKLKFGRGALSFSKARKKILLARSTVTSTWRSAELRIKLRSVSLSHFSKNVRALLLASLLAAALMRADAMRVLVLLRPTMASHLRPSSAAFITIIAESDFRYRQGGISNASTDGSRRDASG